MPVLAQTSCDTDYAFYATNTPSGDCVTVHTNAAIWDGRELANRNVLHEFEATGAHCDIPRTMRNAPKFYNAFLLGGSVRDDNGPVQAVGVNPATLRPEAIDLAIFPSIKISDQLSLTPSLSYSEDVCMTRLGRVHYGAPKAWRNHYGELVVMLAGTIQNRAPLNQFDLSNQDPPTGVIPTVSSPREVQLFFVDAKGQQVNFYPDPAHFSDDIQDNVDTPIVDHFRYWYSGEGNYRLEDKNHDSSTPNTFEFELKTPEGLILSFER